LIFSQLLKGYSKKNFPLDKIFVNWYTSIHERKHAGFALTDHLSKRGDTSAKEEKVG